MTQVKDTVTTERNVFSGMPAHGEVLGKLTRDELAQYFDLQDELSALQWVGPRDRDTVNKVMELKKEIRMLWQDFCRRNNMSMAWEFGLDEVTGNVYMINKE